MGRPKPLAIELTKQGIVEILTEFAEMGKFYATVGTIRDAFLERHAEHYAKFADPRETCRRNVQGRLSNMVNEAQWPVKSRDKDYLLRIGYPDTTVLYYLSDRPEPPPPCGDGSDVA